MDLKEVMGMIRGSLKNNNGQALMEAVIVLPLVLIIIFGIISFGIYIFDKSIILLSCTKAMDHSIGMLQREDITEGEKVDKVLDVAKKYADLGIFLQAVDNGEEPEEIIYSDVENDEKVITVCVRRKFVCPLPLMDTFFGDNVVIEESNSYAYKEARVNDEG